MGQQIYKAYNISCALTKIADYFYSKFELYGWVVRIAWTYL